MGAGIDGRCEGHLREGMTSVMVAGRRGLR